LSPGDRRHELRQPGCSHAGPRMRALLGVRPDLSHRRAGVRPGAPRRVAHPPRPARRLAGPDAGGRVSAAPRRKAGAHTLALDIGGTHIKSAVLDARGLLVAPPVQAPTPRPATPARVLRVIAGLAAAAPRFQRVAAGFPGVVQDGVTLTAVNPHPAWRGVDLARRLVRLTGRPSRVANDADVQG